VLAYTVAVAPAAAPASGIVGGFGALVLLYLLSRANDDLLAVPPACLGVAYAVALVVRGRGVDGAAPLVAAGVFLASELAAWSITERLAIPAESGIVLRRAGALGALVVAGLAVAALVVALASASAGAGLAWTVVGAGAAVGIVGLAVGLARRV
jgi:hypothetical protein